MKWKEVKKMVLERDKKCRKCGAKDSLTVDHVIPLSRGGTDLPGNLTTLCRSCNMNKSSFIDWGILRRIRIAMYVDELVLKTSTDLKATIQSSIAVNKNNITEGKTWLVNYVNGRNEQSEAKISALEKKVEALESYLKIAYIKDVKVVEGYKKVK